MISKRKPYNNKAGYIASLRSGLNKGWVVIYNANEQGLDLAIGKYAVVCETHNTILSTSSMPKARALMKSCQEWCYKCRGEE